MEEFKKKSLVERRKMLVKELDSYYAELRKNSYYNGNKIKGIEFRKKIYFLIKIILKIDQLLSKEKIVILNDRHNIKSSNPRIYACTHSGGDDIQRALQVANESAFLMLGNPGILYRLLIYKGLELNGVIPLETFNSEDRKIAYNRSIELLSSGGNLLIFPEGAWNVSPNLIVMKLFSGAVRMAQETGAEIVPIGVEQYDDTFYFNIGENYTISDNSSKTIDELNDELREKLATLKWEIYETQPVLEHDILNDNYLSTFQREIIERCNPKYGFTLEDALLECYHDKKIVSEEEVFRFMKELEIGCHNAK